jgi:hypothetical protein
MATIHELVPRAALYLVQVVVEHRLTTYTEVAEALGTSSRVVPKVLAEVQTVCIENGWPPITVLVVTKSTGTPGEGFLDPWLPRTAPPSRRAAMVENFRRTVYVFDWAPLSAYYADESGRQSSQKIQVLMEAWYKGGEIQIALPDGFRTTISSVRSSGRAHEELHGKLDSLLRPSSAVWRMRSGA